MEHKFEEYFTLLKPTEELASDFVAYMIDKDSEGCIANLGKDIFPKSVMEDESERSFISVLKGAGYLSDMGSEEVVDYTLVESFFAERCFNIIWESIKVDFEDKSSEDINSRLQGKKLVDFLRFPIKIQLGEGFKNILIEALLRRNIKIIDICPTDNYVLAFEAVLALQEALESGVVNTKTDYIYELAEKGFDLISDDTEVMGKTSVSTDVLLWLKSISKESSNSLGYKSNIIFLNRELLKKEGYLDIKDMTMWTLPEDIQNEDLKWRVFIRENNFSLDILIKVPIQVSTSNFDFSNKENNANVAYIFNNDKYNCNLLNQPKLQNLKVVKVNSSYDIVRVSIIKDLLEFKNNPWLLSDYLLAAKGKETPFSNFNYLPLGEEIVVGVKPNDLKADRFDYSGKYCNSGMIMGGAGSGKSALLHSLIVQFLALQGDCGNGSVMLLDAKQELPGAWKDVFVSRGIPFYGWDARIIKDTNSAKQQVFVGGNTPKEISVINGVTQYMSALFFLTVYQDILNTLLGDTNKEHIKDFNKSSDTWGTITRMPRTAIFIDEWNVLYNAIGKNPLFRTLADLITGYPRKTRTQGLMWFYCGQDLAKSYIGSDKLSSIGYRIVGAMSSDRYEYFNIKENEAIKEYEEKNYTGSGGKPIMSQGSFYAGQAGQTEFVRSMFAGEGAEKRGACLDILESTFPGMHEMDAIVKYALQEGLFEKFSTITVNKDVVKTNLALVALHDIGIIDDEEFYARTDKIFGGNKMSSQGMGGIDVNRLKEIRDNRAKRVQELTDKEKLSEEEQVEKETLESKIKDADEKISENIDSLIATLMPYYRQSLQNLEKDISDLKAAQTKGKIEDFIKKQNLIKNKLEGAFEVDKQTFLGTTLLKLLKEKNVTDEALVQNVITYFTNLYAEKLGDARNLIDNMQYIGKSDTSTQQGQGDAQQGQGDAQQDQGDAQQGQGVTQQGQGAMTQSYDRPQSPNKPQGDVITSKIDTEGMSFAEGKNSRNMKTLKEIADLVITDILSQSGGDIYSLGLNASGSFIVNDFVYIPEFSEDFLESFRDKQMVYRRFANGDMTVVVDTGYVIRNLMLNVQQLSIEYPRFERDLVFWNQLGVKNLNYPSMFKRNSALQVVNVCGEVYNRDDMYSGSTSNGGGLLSRLFNLERNPRVPNPDRYAPNENSIVNRVFNSAPVRILASAFGWTMGVKAVMLAATMFGPMGLLFGAIAAGGAYKEIKENNQNAMPGAHINQGQYRQGQYRQGQNRQGQNRQRRNNGNRQNTSRKNNQGGYNPMTGGTKKSNNNSNNNFNDDNEIDF